jgi:hypothetical protein
MALQISNVVPLQDIAGTAGWDSRKINVKDGYLSAGGLG